MAFMSSSPNLGRSKVEARCTETVTSHSYCLSSQEEERKYRWDSNECDSEEPNYTVKLIESWLEWWKYFIYDSLTK